MTPLGSVPAQNLLGSLLELSAGAVSSKTLTGAGGCASGKARSHSCLVESFTHCWLEALAPHHMGLSVGLLERLQDMAAGFF